MSNSVYIIITKFNRMNKESKDICNEFISYLPRNNANFHRLIVILLKTFSVRCTLRGIVTLKLCHF